MYSGLTLLKVSSKAFNINVNILALNLWAEQTSVCRKVLWHKIMTESCVIWSKQKLKRQSTKYRAEKTYPTTAADKQDNVKKNRYKDIVPCEYHI